MIFCMPIDEQDAQLGRLLREKKEAEKNLAALKEKAGQRGRDMEALASALRRDPTAIGFDHRSQDVRFKTHTRVVGPLLSFEELVDLIESIRNEQVRLWDLEASLRNLGY